MTTNADLYTRELDLALSVLDRCRLNSCTRLAYRGGVSNFFNWRREIGDSSDEVSEKKIALWISDRARQGIKRGTMITYLAALLKWQRQLGKHIRRDAEDIQGALGSLGSEKGARNALLRGQVDRVLDSLSEERPIDIRDGAMIALGWGGALRRSEIVDLDWQRLGSGAGYICMDGPVVRAKLLRHEGGAHADVDVEIQGEYAQIAKMWLDLWVCAAELEPGTPVFRQVGKAGRIGTDRLSDRTVSAVIKKRFKDRSLSGDSLSIGVLMDAMGQVPTIPVGVYLEALSKRLRYASISTMMTMVEGQYRRRW